MRSAKEARECGMQEIDPDTDPDADRNRENGGQPVEAS
jgi:hypothetical protein